MGATFGAWLCSGTGLFRHYPSLFRSVRVVLNEGYELEMER